MNKQRGNGAQSPWSWFAIVVGAALVLGVGSVRPVWATVVQNPCAGVADGTPCDDSDPCTVGESCQGEVCTGGSPAPDGTSCDDFDPCTVNDTCIDGLCQGGGANPQCGCCQFDSYLSSVFGETAASVFGSCSSPVTESFCSQELGGTFQSGASCDLETGLCEPAATCGNGVVEAGEECDDGNTVGGDCCDAQCHFEPVESPCDDGNACTIEDACDGEGSCVGGVPLTCDDGNVCNGVESCDPQFGCQAGTPLTCDDGNVCNGVESCDPQFGCQAGTPLNCDDGNVCNGVESCDPQRGCQPGTPLTCDDGNVCNGVESCDPQGGCQAGTPLNCDDGNVCNGVESCDPQRGCQAGTPLTCDDGDVCNGVESCDPQGGCQAGTPLTCDDGDVCNGVESCDPQLGCQAGMPLTCDDGDACNGVESCDPQLGCQAGTPVSCAPAVPPCEAGEQCNPSTGLCEPLPDPPNTTPCDLDQNVCTTDRCDGAGSCVFVENAASGTSCDDGLFCNGTDTCDGSGTCEHSGDPCVGGAECNQICNEAQDNCFDPPGTPCSDDGLVCTADACNGSGSCAHTALPPAQCPKGYVLLEAPSTATATAELGYTAQANNGAACAEMVRLKQASVLGSHAVGSAGVKVGKDAVVNGLCVTSGSAVSFGTNGQCTGGTDTTGMHALLGDCQGAADKAEQRRQALLLLSAHASYGSVTIGSNTTLDVTPFSTVPGAVVVIDYGSLTIKPNRTLTIKGNGNTEAVVLRVSGNFRARMRSKLVTQGIAAGPGGLAAERVLILVGGTGEVRMNAEVEGTIFSQGAPTVRRDAILTGALVSPASPIRVRPSAVVNHAPWVLW